MTTVYHYACEQCGERTTSLYCETWDAWEAEIDRFMSFHKHDEPAPPPPLTSVRLVAAIARVLRHGCAPTVEQEKQSPSLRALNAFMRANAIAYNDGLAEGLGWASCHEGWTEESFIGSNDVMLSWTTGSGRLSIEALQPYGVLRFVAGPETPGGDGRLCAVIWISMHPDDCAAEAAVVPDLLTGREDRIDLLARIDRELGGQITDLLRTHGGDPGVQVLEALDRLAAAEVPS